MVREGDINCSTPQEKQVTSCSSAPSQCSSRKRVEDAAEAVRDMASLMRQMNPEVVKKLVHARNVAASVYEVFPGGDQRFADFESDDDADNSSEVKSSEMPDDSASEIEPIDDQNDPCQGLFDATVHNGPLECLKRTKEDYNIDIVAEMDKAGLQFFDRIRLVNFIRRMISEGEAPAEAIRRVRYTLSVQDESFLKDNSLLEPVIEGDLLLTVLESPEADDSNQNHDLADLRHAVEHSLRQEHVLP